MCESRSASNPQSPGFAFSDTNACTIYMNNGQAPEVLGILEKCEVLPLGCLSLQSL